MTETRLLGKMTYLKNWEIQMDHLKASKTAGDLEAVLYPYEF